MKNIKKLLGIVLVLTLVLSLGANAFASTVTIVPDTDKVMDEGSQYDAYQLLTAKFVRNDPDKGDVYEYSINDKYLAAINAGISAVQVDSISTNDGQAIERPGELALGNYKALENQVLEYISGLDDTGIRQFADGAYKQIKAASTEADKVAGGEGGNVFTDMNGYYLIAETVNPGTNSAVTSLVMLKTAGKEDITVRTKEERPSSKKEVEEKNDTVGDTATAWKNVADYDKNDPINFKLSGTIVDSHYNDYTNGYQLQFVDTISKGLTYQRTTSIYYIEKDGTEKVPMDTLEPSSNDDYTGPKSEYAGGRVLTWDLGNIKAKGVPQGATVYIEYVATLNDGALIGSAGNPNESHIVFSNDPYSNGTGHTPDTKVTVYTFDLDVYKEDGINRPLDGAGFTLLKKVAGAGSVTIDKKEYTGVVQVGEEKTVELKDGKYVVNFDRLDAGEYILVESTVPDGYNKAEDVAFSITASYDEEGNLTGLSAPEGQPVTVKADNAGYETTVINLNGLELPSTGGIGTTIFYVVGAILVAGAVILLVTKKRASDANK